MPHTAPTLNTMHMIPLLRLLREATWHSSNTYGMSVDDANGAKIYRARIESNMTDMPSNQWYLLPTLNRKFLVESWSQCLSNHDTMRSRIISNILFLFCFMQSVIAPNKRLTPVSIALPNYGPDVANFVPVNRPFPFEAGKHFASDECMACLDEICPEIFLGWQMSCFGCLVSCLVIGVGL